MEEISESLVSHTYALPFDDHLMENCLPGWNNTDSYVKDLDLSSDEDDIIMVIEDDFSKDESLNTFLLNDDGDVIDLKSLPPIDDDNPIFDNGIDANDIDSLLEKFEASNNQMDTITRCRVPRSNSMPLFGTYKGDYLCIDELTSPKSTFTDIENISPPTNFASIEPIKFISPENKTSVSKPISIPIKSRGKTLRRLVSALSGMSKVSIPKDAILSSSEDESSPNNKPKIKLVPITPEFKNDLRRSNRIAKVPISSIELTSPISKSDSSEVMQNDIQIIESKTKIIELSPKKLYKEKNVSELEPKILFPPTSTVTHVEKSNLIVKKPNLPIETPIIKEDKSIIKEEKSIIKEDKSIIKEDKPIIKEEKPIIKKEKAVIPIKVCNHDELKLTSNKEKLIENEKITLQAKIKINSKKVNNVTNDIHDKCLIPKNSKSYLKKKSKVKRILQPSKSILIPIINNKLISKKRPLIKGNTVGTMSAPSSPVMSPIQALSYIKVKNELSKVTLVNNDIKSKKIVVSQIHKISNKCEIPQPTIESVKDKKKGDISIYVNDKAIKKDTLSEIAKSKCTGENKEKKCPLIQMKSTKSLNDKSTKKLSLSSYRCRRKIRAQSTHEGTIVVVNEPFFKDIPDHSYCSKNKVITNLKLEPEINITSIEYLSDIIPHLPSRIRHNTNNDLIDMDIDSDCAIEDGDDSTNNTVQQYNYNIFDSEDTEINHNKPLQIKEEIKLNSKNKLTPVNVSKESNCKDFNISPDSAVESPSILSSSDNIDSTNEETHSSPSADSGVSEWPSTSYFKSTFKPIDNVANNDLPLIYDIHEKNIQNSNKFHNFKNSTKSFSINKSPTSSKYLPNYSTVLSFNSQITSIYVKPIEDQNINNRNDSRVTENCISQNENSIQNDTLDSHEYPEKKVFDKYYSSGSEYDYDSDFHSSNRRYNKRSKRSSYNRYSRSRSPNRRYMMSEFRKQEFEERRIVYVGKIPEDYSNKDLEDKFISFGEIEDISIHIRELGDNYGFITYRYTKDAYNAIEHGNKVKGCEHYDMCFGGRRHFCKQKYADLDGNLQDDEEAGYCNTNNTEMDFDSMLKAAQKNIKRR